MSDEDGVLSARRGREPTLKEVARAAGVHVSTVSRVLRQVEPPYGWTEAALRVRKAARELGYRSNLSAVSLRTRQTMTIGVVMPRLTDSVAATTCQAIEEAATRAGYQMLLASPSDEIQPQLETIDMLLRRQVDGLILSNLHSPACEILDELRERAIPTLLVSRHADTNGPSVTLDNRSGGYVATEYLIKLGHERIALIRSQSHTSVGNDRARGYIDAFDRYGLSVDQELVVESDVDVAGGVEAARYLLTRHPRPTAVFAVNDEAALGVLGVARDLELQIPEDLSVVGFNDVPMAAQLPVPLTTIRTPVAKMGCLAVERLLELINGKSIKSAILPVELVVRGSCGPPPLRSGPAT